MKYDNVAAFQKHVENTPKEHILPVYLFLCSDTLLVTWLMEWTHRAFGSLELVKASKFEKELFVPTLFSKEKVVMLQLEQLSEHPIEIPPKGISLFVALPKLEASNAFYKKAEKNGVVLHLANLKPWEKESFLMEYLMQRAKKERFQLAGDAAKALVTRSNHDPYAIDSNFDKLTLWKHEERKISLADLAVVGPFDEEETLFRLTDAILGKKRSQSQEIAARLIDQGVAPLFFLKTFRGQCSILYELQNHLQGRLSLEEITSRHAYLRGNILEQKMTLAKMHSLVHLKKLLLKSDELERLYKNTSLTDEVFLEFAVASLS